MKSNFHLLISIISALSLYSCGPSGEEIERLKAIEKAKADSILIAQRQHDDSIKLAVEKATLDLVARKSDLQQSIKSANDSLRLAKNLLIENKASLEVAYDKMNSLKEFQFGRSQSERESQIKYQSLTIQSLEERIAAIQEYIMLTETKIKNLNSELQNLK